MVKQALRYVRSLESHTWVELMFFGIHIIIKQMSGYVRSLGPHI